MKPFDLSGKRVFVAGHRGLVGSAIMRRLARESCMVLTAGRAELDLRRQESVERWLEAERPEAVFFAAAKVGGIFANSTYPAQFLYDNLAIETNLIHASDYGVKKLVFLGPSCIYPKLAPQPIEEDALLTGPLEPTNEWYAIAKIAGLKLCEAYRRQYGCDFVSAMPTNLYGPGDNFDLAASHVLPALIRKMHDAKAAGAAILGHRRAAARVSACGRLRRCACAHHEALLGEPAHQCGLRGRSFPSSISRSLPRVRLASRARLCTTCPSPTARQES